MEVQAPEFLYRVEVGEPAALAAKLTQPTSCEMATRLSYVTWGVMAALTSRNDTNPVVRGGLVRSQLFCKPTPSRRPR